MTVIARRPREPLPASLRRGQWTGRPVAPQGLLALVKGIADTGFLVAFILVVERDSEVPRVARGPSLLGLPVGDFPTFTSLLRSRVPHAGRERCFRATCR